MLYVKTDINIPISISGVAIGDISDIAIRFAKRGVITNVEFKLSSGEIDIIAGQMTLRIPKTAITEPDVYSIVVLVTDSRGEFLGLTPQPSTLTFNSIF